MVEPPRAGGRTERPAPPGDTGTGGYRATDAFADAVAWAARSLPVRPSSPVLAGLLIEASDAGLVLSTFAEIRSALDYVDNHAPLSVQRIAYTGLLQGLRPEERYALDWSCFDMTAKTLTISEACSSFPSRLLMFRKTS